MSHLVCTQLTLPFTFYCSPGNIHSCHTPNIHMQDFHHSQVVYSQSTMPNHLLTNLKETSGTRSGSWNLKVDKSNVYSAITNHQRIKLIICGYGRHGSQWVNCSLHPNYAKEYFILLPLFSKGIDCSPVGHTIWRPTP